MLELDHKNNFSLQRITKTNQLFTNKNESFENLKEGTIVLVNSENEIVTCLGSLTLDPSIVKKEKIAGKFIGK